MKTEKELKIFWWAPAATFVFQLLLVVLMAYGSRDVGTLAVRLYKPMFFVTPVVGIGVLLSLLVILFVHQPLLQRIKTARTIAVAILDVLSPPITIVLGIVLSGFSR